MASRYTDLASCARLYPIVERKIRITARSAQDPLQLHRVVPSDTSKMQLCFRQHQPLTHAEVSRFFGKPRQDARCPQLPVRSRYPTVPIRSEDDGRTPLLLDQGPPVNACLLLPVPFFHSRRGNAFCPHGTTNG